jgi:hypothetical protein
MSDRLPSPTLTVYRRSGCHLCDEVDDAIAVVLAERGAEGRMVPELRPVDVDTAPDLASRYGGLVPVLAIGEAELPLVMGARHVRRFLAAQLDGAG